MTRYHDLKDILEGRRRDINAKIRTKLRDSRKGNKSTDIAGVRDADEPTAGDIQEELEFAVMQMQAETLGKIELALMRLENGNYGNCFACGEEIEEKRLRALPFAIRCKDCEEKEERADKASHGKSQKTAFYLDALQ